jgi:hypothetical protein
LRDIPPPCVFSLFSGEGMSLPRWILFSPVVVIMVVGLAAHLASQSASIAWTAQGRAGSSSSDVQQARSVDRALERAAARGRVAVELAAGNVLDRALFPLSAASSLTNSKNPKSTRSGSGKPTEIETEGAGKTAGVSLAAGKKGGMRGSKSAKTPPSAEESTVEAWVSPHYEAWKPAAVFGPPLPPERVRVQRAAHRLLEDLRAGRLSVMMDERDGEQLRCLLRDGVYCWPAPPSGVSVRSPRQHDVLEGTLEDEAAPPVADRLLASRSALPRRAPTANPADDPNFDPCATPPAPGLLRLLTTLSAHSTPSRPLEIMSLLRPPYRFGGFVHVGPANPHSMGLGVDIAAYGGHAIRQSEPETCVAAVLALLRDLPPGRYRLGMPKAPEGGWDMPPALIALLGRPSYFLASVAPAEATPQTEAVQASMDESKEESKSGSRRRNKKSAIKNTAILNDALDDGAATPKPGMTKFSVAEAEEATGCTLAALYGLHASSAKPAWPFFPPPFREVAEAEISDPDENSVGTLQTTGSRNPLKTVLRFQNEAYAPESALNDIRLRSALEAARRRGADVIALFPDGADHIHVDVRQNP